MSIEVRKPFVRFNDAWHPFWDISRVVDYTDHVPTGILVAYASAGNKGEMVEAPLGDVLAAIAEASGLG